MKKLLVAALIVPVALLGAARPAKAGSKAGAILTGVAVGIGAALILDALVPPPVVAAPRRRTRRHPSPVGLHAAAGRLRPAAGGLHAAPGDRDAAAGGLPHAAAVVYRPAPVIVRAPRHVVHRRMRSYHHPATTARGTGRTSATTVTATTTTRLPAATCLPGTQQRAATAARCPFRRPPRAVRRTLGRGSRHASDGRPTDARAPRPPRRRAGRGAPRRGAGPADAGGARAGQEAQPHDGRSARQGADHRPRGPGLPEPPPRAHRRPARLPPRAVRGAPVHGLVGARRAPAGRRHGALPAEPGGAAHREPPAPRDAERHPARRGGGPPPLPRGAAAGRAPPQSEPARRGDPRRGRGGAPAGGLSRAPRPRRRRVHLGQGLVGLQPDRARRLPGHRRARRGAAPHALPHRRPASTIATPTAGSRRSSSTSTWRSTATSTSR